MTIVDDKLKNTKEQMNRYFYSTGTNQRIKLKVNEKIKTTRKTNFFYKKISLVSVIILLAISVLIGSTYFSTTMANVLAKVPFLSEFMEKSMLQDEEYDKLRKSLFKKIDSTHLYNIVPNYDEKQMLVIMKGSDQYIQENKEEIITIVQREMENGIFKDFDIKIQQYEKPDEISKISISEETQKLMDRIDNLSTAIQDKLANTTFSKISFGISANKTISFELPYYFEKEKLESLLKQVIEEGNFQDFTLDIQTIDQEEMEKRDQEKRWSTVFNYIHEGLQEKQELKVTGFAYSNHPSPMTIIIKTSIHPWSFGKKDKIDEIERLVTDFLSSEKADQYVRDEPYKLIIRDKDHDPLFKKEFTAK